MTITLRIIAWLLAAAVTFATLGPPSYRPHSNLGQDGEHALAFVLIGVAFGLAYTEHRLRGAVIAVIVIGALELLQFWAPGRHARLEDFVVDALTACVGLAVAAALDWAMQRLRSTQTPPEPSVTSRRQSSFRGARSANRRRATKSGIGANSEKSCRSCGFSPARCPGMRRHELIAG